MGSWGPGPGSRGPGPVIRGKRTPEMGLSSGRKCQESWAEAGRGPEHRGLPSMIGWGRSQAATPSRDLPGGKCGHRASGPVSVKG